MNLFQTFTDWLEMKPGMPVEHPSLLGFIAPRSYNPSFAGFKLCMTTAQVGPHRCAYFMYDDQGPYCVECAQRAFANEPGA